MKPVGIYIHVPFCRYKCPYCDFYSVTAKDERMDSYTEETVRRLSGLAGQGIAADTVYFGGGTPSLLGGRRITRIMEAARRSVAVTEDAEITVEANPASDLGEFLEGCAAAGVNRLSLGMQSALPKELSSLGRRHSPDDVLRAMEQAHGCGVGNISLDLMLGIPMQTAGTGGIRPVRNIQRRQTGLRKPPQSEILVLRAIHRHRAVRARLFRRQAVFLRP